MTSLTWHLEKAKESLEYWYDKAEGFLRQEQFFLNLVVPCEKAANDCKRKALHCKTAGLVWHDRFKMVMDTKRKLK